MIMVGEIRDSETVSIGVRAALVGRLFLSTLHTNDATSAVPRLLDMGVEPFLLASTLVLVMAQRLARRICVACRESAAPEPRALAALRARPDFEHTVRVLQAQGVLGPGDDPLAAVRIFRGRGCAQCQGSGFRGRIGLFELFQVDEEARRLIMERQDGGGDPGRRHPGRHADHVRGRPRQGAARRDHAGGGLPGRALVGPPRGGRRGRRTRLRRYSVRLGSVSYRMTSARIISATGSGSRGSIGARLAG